MKRVYHSALKEEIFIENELNEYYNTNAVFRWDITKGLPKLYSKCDVIYSEPSWLDGYEKFIRRANKEHSTYELYLKSIARIIIETKIPLWLIIGSHALKKLPPPFRIEKIKLHGYTTNLLGWNDDLHYDFNDNYNFIGQLAMNYNWVGDFNCGYGNTGRIFKEAGKNFIMSDINGKCIFSVAKNLMDYEDSIS